MACFDCAAVTFVFGTTLETTFVDFRQGKRDRERAKGKAHRESWILLAHIIEISDFHSQNWIGENAHMCRQKSNGFIEPKSKWYVLGYYDLHHSLCFIALDGQASSPFACKKFILSTAGSIPHPHRCRYVRIRYSHWNEQIKQWRDI